MKSLKRILYLTLLCTLAIGSLVGQTTVKIVGVVKDVKGEPMIGVQVVPVGATQKGGLTDFDGKYVLNNIPSSVQEITFSYIGYVSQTIKIKGRKQINVVMKEDNKMLDQVVVTALGIKRSQKALSYNVQELKGDVLQTNKDANFVSSLNGKVAGVTINQSSAGIGSAAKVVMRGSKSIEKSNNALYVIDGVPIYSTTAKQGEGRFSSTGSTEGAADINPDDIESISVLTGASAAALYGSSAANGAIIITTKKGKSGAVKVNYSHTNEWGAPLRLPEFQNTYGSDGQLESWGHKLSLSKNNSRYNVKDFFQTSRVVGNSVSLSGGTEKNQTYISLASTRAKGLVPNNAYSRYNINVRNTTSLLNDKLKLDASVTYVNQYHRNMINQGQYMNPMVSAYLMPRSESLESAKAFETLDVDRNIYIQNWRYGAGNYTLQNPYWIAYRNLRETDRERYMLSYSASYELMKWSNADKWNISARVRYDNTNIKSTDKRYASTDATHDVSVNGYYGEVKGKDLQTYADVISTFNKGFDLGNDNRLNVNATIGTSFQDSRYDQSLIEGPLNVKGIPNLFNIFNIGQTENKTNLIPMGWQEQTQSIFASAEVGFNSYLYLTVTGRNDWASQLANSPNSSFFYPSVGLSAVVTEMLSRKAKANLRPYLSYLKVRASYASVGSPFMRGLTSPTYEPNKDSKTYKSVTHYPIGELFPERTNSYEIGISSRWFGGALTLDGSVYRTVTENQTMGVGVPPASGYDKIYLQTGSVQNQGVELAVGLNFGKEDGLRYSTNFTLGYNQNEILELAENYENPITGQKESKKALTYGGLGSLSYELRKGGTLGDIYTNADFKRDVNGNIYVDENGIIAIEQFKKGQKKKLGSVLPKANYGWSHEIAYKGFKIGAMLMARQGGLVVSATQAALDDLGVSKATAEARDKGFVRVGNQSLDPKLYFQARGKNNGLAQYYTYDATNIRLAEAHISYKLPRKFLFNKADLTLSLVGRNLGFLYIKAPFDPESISSTGNYSQGLDYFMMPSQRTIGFSVKVGF